MIQLLLCFLMLPFSLPPSSPVGNYRGKHGGFLRIHADGSYGYASFECYHWVRDTGRFSFRGDTLRLHTQNLSFQPVLQMTYGKTDRPEILIQLSDTSNSPPLLYPVVVFSENRLHGTLIDSLGQARFALPSIDSIRIGGINETTYVPRPLGPSDSLNLLFREIYFPRRDRFTEEPFLVRGDKIYRFYEGKRIREAAFTREK